MNMESYISAIMRKVKLPNPLKKHIREDLENNLADRLESGMSFEDIQKDMGTPTQIASDILRSYQETYNHKAGSFRYLYIVFASIPFAYALVVLIHIFTTPQPSGFSTHKDFFSDLFANHLITIVILCINFLLYLLICILGYVALRNQTLLGKKTVLAMLISEVAIAILLQPAVIGMKIIPVYVTFTTPLATLAHSLLWGVLQPQSLLAIVTLAITIRLYRKKRIRASE